MVFAATGIGLTQCDQMPSSAIEAWATPGADRRDIREWALAHALLAPNPHNMQPWIADLREEGAITLHVDPDRLLPETDPYGRQILIGHGTFLELLDLAAQQAGYRARIDLFPNGSASATSDAASIAQYPVARIGLIKDGSLQPDPLFAAIQARRSCKEPFDVERDLSEGHAADLRASNIDPAIGLTLTLTGSLPATLRDLTRDAMTLEMKTPRTLRESIDVMRIGADEIAENPDGIDLNGPMFWWLKKFGLMTREKAMTPGTMAYQGGIDYALGWADATPSFGWITTEHNDRPTQVAAGRAYVRLNLQATASGVAMHPVSQLLQEYPEMTDLQRRFYGVTETPSGHTVQMLFRLGYAESPGPTPRRPLDALLRT
ncbi:twin-arginine translocation pathway signal protein [Hwanghaeella grinnelliae]|uniref:Twin-arginine translocation pathway signal protein n=1 Tax=Hwanghaeella grinnelliae TaxID=2500179 RepID=A0A437QKM4_9PROT|nr:twin-arginine translocation pathway signal protein [Hwanghaeella grinnelliae]